MVCWLSLNMLNNDCGEIYVGKGNLKQFNVIAQHNKMGKHKGYEDFL